VSIDKIVVMETATDKVPNTSPTAASVQTDVNGAAVLDACNQIVKRLAPLREKFPNKTFAELCQEAHFQRISLSAQGFYRTPDLEIFDFARKVQQTDVNRPFNYYTEGVACAEVELDTLSGDFVVRRSDILMDVGKSINPGLDVDPARTRFLALLTRPATFAWRCCRTIPTFGRCTRARALASRRCFWARR
jgi:xanthine dehydrogenase/oxidase